jgi:MFS family permease
MSDESVNTEENGNLPRRAFAVGSLTTLATGLHSPFLQDYVIKMGATLAEQGIFRSVGNFAPTMMQPLWGALSDRVGRRKYFVAFGTFSGFLMVLMFFFAATPLEMIVLYGIQSVLLSIQIPTWLALISDYMTEENRGNELGKLSVITNSTSLIATLITGTIAVLPGLLPYLRTLFGDFGPILFPTAESWREMYYVPFLLTAIIGIITSLIALTLRENPETEKGSQVFPPIIELLSKPGDFRRFCLVSVFFSFSMSMAWVYFMVVQSEWLGQTPLEIAITSSLMTITIVIFTSPMGRVADRIGRKPMIIAGRSMLFVVPFLYAFSSPPFGTFTVYLANVIAGFAVAMTMNAITAYIYDVSPQEERGAHLAVYNTFTGGVFLLGSLFSGFFGYWIEILMSSRYIAVFLMLVLSGTLRFFASFLYMLIREPREYTSTLRDEIRNKLYRFPYLRSKK